MEDMNELIRNIDNEYINVLRSTPENNDNSNVDIPLRRFDMMRNEIKYLRNAKNSIIDAIQKGDGITVKHLKPIGYRDYVFLSNDKVILELNDVITKLKSEITNIRVMQKTSLNLHILAFQKIIDSLKETISELRNENRLLKDREPKGFWNWFK